MLEQAPDLITVILEVTLHLIGGALINVHPHQSQYTGCERYIPTHLHLYKHTVTEENLEFHNIL